MKLENGRIYLHDENGNPIKFGSNAKMEITPILSESETDLIRSDLSPLEVSFTAEISELGFNRLVFSSPEDSILDSEIIG